MKGPSVLPSAVAGGGGGRGRGDQLSHLLQVVRGKRGRHLSLACHHMADEAGRTALLLSYSQGQLVHAAKNMISSIVLPRSGTETALLSAIEVRGRVRSPIPCIQ